MDNSVTISTGLVAMGVRLGIFQLCVKKNVLSRHTEETVGEGAVNIVTGHVTERLVCVMEVVETDGNLICVIENVMTQIMEEIVANRAVSVTKEFLATRKMDCVPWGVLLALKESTVTNHVIKRSMDVTAT